MKDDNKAVPRWQQGIRPFAHGDTWDAMSPVERRRAFVGDLLIGFGVPAAILFLGWLYGF